MKKRPRVEVYAEVERDADGFYVDTDYRWRLKAANGRIIADSGGYMKRSEAHKAAWRVILACNDIDTWPGTDRVVDL